MRNFIEDYNNQKWLFVTEDDIKSLPCFQNETLIAVKAPHGTTLEFPDSDEQSEVTSPNPPLPDPPNCTVYSFCETLTASDTSTHGGFSVIQRHADDYLPPLDMSRQPPWQELVGSHLHSNE